METLELTKRTKTYFPTDKSPKEKEIMTFEKLQNYERLIAEGKMKSEPKVVRPFTPEERYEFDNGHTVDEIFDNLNKKYGLNI